MVSQGYAVIDFETTGLVPEQHHRIVELAVVHVDPHGGIEGRWETVINPERDLGPTHIHGLTGAEVMHAPHFDDIASQFVGLLSNRVVVAHNASFEARFLRAELRRIDAHSPVANDGALCTMKLARDFLPGAGRSLADCCAAYDIELTNAHEALADTEATALLLSAYLQQDPRHMLWGHYQRAASEQQWPSISHPSKQWMSRRREDQQPRSFLHQAMALLPEDVDLNADDASLDYLAQLDQALADGFISLDEADGLHDLAQELGIGERKRRQMHLRYFDDLVKAAWADNVLTDRERTDITNVAKLLDIDEDRIADALDRAVEAALVPPPVAPAPSNVTLNPGDLVVLTGEMTRPRAYYEDLLRSHELVPWAAVTKKVKLVIAADPDSLSGKARKARQYGIPIASESEFVTALAASVKD